MGGERGWVKHIVVGLRLAVKSLTICIFEVCRDEKKDVPERFLTISRLQWVTMKEGSQKRPVSLLCSPVAIDDIGVTLALLL